MNTLFYDLCFPFLLFQVERVAFELAPIMTFSYLTLFAVQNRVSIF